MKNSMSSDFYAGEMVLSLSLSLYLVISDKMYWAHIENLERTTFQCDGCKCAANTAIANH